MTRSKGYDKDAIMYLLKSKGVSMRDISRALNYKNADTARTVFHSPVHRVEQLISSILGIYPQDIWPERYHSNGEPRYTPRKHNNEQINVRHVQNLRGYEHA